MYLIGQRQDDIALSLSRTNYYFSSFFSKDDISRMHVYIERCVLLTSKDEIDAHIRI